MRCSYLFHSGSPTQLCFLLSVSPSCPVSAFDYRPPVLTPVCPPAHGYHGLTHLPKPTFIFTVVYLSWVLHACGMFIAPLSILCALCAILFSCCKLDQSSRKDVVDSVRSQRVLCSCFCQRLLAPRSSRARQWQPGREFYLSGIPQSSNKQSFNRRSTRFSRPPQRSAACGLCRAISS